MKKILPLLLFVIFCLSPLTVFSADKGDANAFNYSGLNKQLNKIDETLKSGNVSSQYMAEITQTLSTLRQNIEEGRSDLTNELEYTQKKLLALGEVPSDGEKEISVIAQKRKEFNDELSKHKGRIAEADILLTHIDKLDSTVFNLRSKELFGSMLNKQEALIYPSNLYASGKLFINFMSEIVYSPLSWYQALSDRDKLLVQSNLIPVLIVFFLSLWIGVYLRLFIMRKFGYNEEIEHPRYGKKVSAAICVAIGYGVIPASIIAGMLIWMAGSNLLNDYFGMVAGSFLYFILYILLGRAIARVTFAPFHEKWRLVNVSDEKALLLTKTFYGAIEVICFLSFLEYVAGKSNFPITLSSFIATLGCFAKGFYIVVLVRRILWDKLPEYGFVEEENSEPEAEEEGNDNVFKFTFLSMVTGVSLIGVAIYGYPFLSSFIFNRLIMSFILIGFLLIVRKAIEEIMHRILLMRFWARNFRIKRKLLVKLNFWLSLVVDPLFILFAAYVVLALWGVSTEMLNHHLIKLLTGFKIGGIKISILSIAIGIAVFFVSVSVVKALKRRLSANVLSKMDIDEGIRASLESGFGSIGFVLSALLAIAIMGGDLSNLALIAGALSVGIGLGLQNIVNNFVSGIILLFERPIKVGDWVIVNGEEGKVKQINIRSTEIETFKKASLIVPNSNILSNTVTNLTHSNKAARMTINIGVSYDANPRRVREILLECAEQHKKVLKSPAPYVVFKDFGESSLDFELRCYTTDIWAGWAIPSDLRYEILDRFNAEGIDIPYPQRGLHISDNATKENLNKLLKHQADSLTPKKRSRNVSKKAE